MIGVFGASGFIGRHLIARLTQDPELDIRAVSRGFDMEFRNKFSGSIEIFETDIKDRFHVASLLDDIDVVVQMISSSSPGLQNYHLVADITDNVIPHVEFLQSCALAKVKKFIFLSSGGTVYGTPATLPIPEEHPNNPLSSHGLTKLAVEHYARIIGAMSQMQVCVVRLANPYGPGQTFRKGQGLIPAILDRHYAGRAVRIYGDGSARRDYIYIDDTVDALEAAIRRDLPAFTALNVGSGTSHSILDIVAALENALGEEIRREYVPTRESDVSVNVLDNSRARAVLDWEPRTDLPEGIRRTVAAYRSFRSS